MAVRIEFFTLSGTTDFEILDSIELDAAVAAFDAGTPAADQDGPVRCVGWLSASDIDEDRFTGWCERVDEDLGIGLLHQGLGEDEGLHPLAVTIAYGEPEAFWSTTLQEAVEAADLGRFAWRTNFDQSGTTGTPDDYPTDSHPAHEHDAG